MQHSFETSHHEIPHIHDSHGGTTGPVLQKYFGNASAPLRVRLIEGLPVITGFTNAEAAKDAGLEIGDVILKVDDEDASQRIAERLKYTAHSTPQSGMFYATERSLVRGSKDSSATFTVRDIHDQVRELKVARKVEYMLHQSQSPAKSRSLRLRYIRNNIFPFFREDQIVRSGDHKRRTAK